MFSSGAADEIDLVKPSSLSAERDSLSRVAKKRNHSRNVQKPKKTHNESLGFEVPEDGVVVQFVFLSEWLSKDFDWVYVNGVDALREVVFI